MIKKVIVIEENSELIMEANALLLLTESSDDVKDEVDISALIDRILKYIQDEEYPLMFPTDAKMSKRNIAIQFIPNRPVMDEAVERLYARKWEIKKRCKNKISEIHIKPNEIEMFYEEN